MQTSTELKAKKQELLDAITNKTKVLILPFPNNPTGAIMEKEDLEDIAEVCIEKNKSSGVNILPLHQNLHHVPGYKKFCVQGRLFILNSTQSESMGQRLLCQKLHGIRKRIES